MFHKRLPALFLALFLSLSLSVPALAEDTAPPPATREESALAAAKAAMQYSAATSMQYALWENGTITLSGQTGVYSKTENRALTADHLYGIGSVSKMYTTAAVMKLVESGKIKLDSPVTRYLPSFKMADERYKQITVRMLLNHSSGLMGGTTNNAFLLNDSDQVATKQLLANLSTQTLKADPGAMSVYCNDGFTLAELVVEAVSGKDFTSFIHEQLLAPLGLKSTFTPQDNFDQTLLAKTYQTAEETRAMPSETLGIIGTGGIYANASDLASFGGALATNTVLSATSTTAMQNAEYKRGLWPSDETDSVAYGLGWDSIKTYPFITSGITALNKGGDTIYYHASLIVLPEQDMAVAVLSSGGVSLYNQQAAARILIDALTAKGVKVDETAPTLPAATKATMPAEMKKHEGYYGNLMQMFHIKISNEGLMTMHLFNTPATSDQTFQYYSDGSFRDESGLAMLSFVPEKNGHTYLYQKSVSPIPGLGYYPMSQYVAQWMPPNEITPELQAKWDALDTMPLLPMNMKYSSVVYMQIVQALATAEQPEKIPGYLNGLRIVDEENALNIYQIPAVGGRDSQNIQLFYDEGVLHYTSPQGIIWRDASSVAPIYTADSAIATIGAKGYTRWYEIADADVGKTMQVTVPKDAAFYVYDATGNVVASSHIYADTSTKLPKGGMIAFVGAANTRFNLSFTA